MKTRIICLTAIFLVSLTCILKAWPEIAYQYHVNVLRQAPLGGYESIRFQRDVEHFGRRQAQVSYKLQQARLDLWSKGSIMDQTNLDALSRTITCLETEESLLSDEYQERIHQAPGLFTTDDFDDQFPSAGGVVSTM